MSSVIIIAIAAVLLAILVSLRHRLSFTKLMFLGLVLGLAYGLVLQLFFSPTGSTIKTAMDWIGIVGNGYIALLQMLVIPLIFVSLVGAFTKMKVNANLKKITTVVLTTLLATTAVAALVGFISVTAFHLQGGSFVKGLSANSTSLAAITKHQQTLKGLTLPQQIVSFIPSNVFAAFSGTTASSTISVVIFSLFTGVAYLGVRDRHPQSAAAFAKGIDALHHIVTGIVHLVMVLTPYGIFALMVNAGATNSISEIAKLGVFVIAAYLAVFVMFLVHTVLLMVNRINPVTYYQKAWPALVFAFTSRTSAGTLPLNIRIQKESLGVSDTIADFSASFGLTIGQNGCAGLYPAMVATIIAPTVGVNVFSWQFILSLIAIVTISSFGVAGVGGGATFTTLMVLGTLGLPVGMMGVLIAIDPIIDMARTALNVNDSILAGVLAAKSTDSLDYKKLNNRQLLVRNFS